MSQYNISNEHIRLVNALERMYSDNIRQINGMTSSINNLRSSNIQIRNSLLQLLNPTINTNYFRSDTRSDTRSDRQINTTSQRLPVETNESVSRVMINNVPYVIDYVEHYRIPSRNEDEERTRVMQQFLEPIEVYPTQSQIETAIRNVQYCDIVNPINRSCPISLETFNDNDIVSVIRFCGHIFKSEQLTTWFRSNCKCPVCRYDIRNYNLNPNINPNINTDINTVNDISNNFVEENRNFRINEERNNTTNNSLNRLTPYLDLIFDNSTRINDNLLNDVTNMVEGTDINALLSIFNTNLRRRL